MMKLTNNGITYETAIKTVLKKPKCVGKKKIKIMVKFTQILLRSTDSIGYICCYGFVLMSHNLEI